MAIYRLLQQSAFGPEDIDRMVAAYEQCLRILAVENRADAVAEAIAKKIVEIAQTGERDAAKLQTRALEALGLPPQ
jgi:hypothetical protein